MIHNGIMFNTSRYLCNMVNPTLEYSKSQKNVNINEYSDAFQSAPIDIDSVRTCVFSAYHIVLIWCVYAGRNSKRSAKTVAGLTYLKIIASRGFYSRL